MTSRAFIIGGTGLIGRALVPRMLEAGWNLTVATRTPVPADIGWPKPVTHIPFDRTTDELAAVLTSRYEVLIDLIPFQVRDAQQLLSIAKHVGSLVAVSTISVYADERGRSIDEAETPEDFPHFPVPIPETHRTVEAGDDTYSTKKAAIEQLLLGESELPVTIVRASSIYGPGDRASREWFFLKRILDRRRTIILAHQGAVPVSVVSSLNLAEIILFAAEKPATRILNAADPEPQSARSIARSIGTLLQHDWDEVLLEGDSPAEPIGLNPWVAPRPVVVDTSLATRELGYQPVTRYEEALRETCDWLISVTANNSWREVLPNAYKYYGTLFDYDAEDRFLASRV